MMTVKKTSGIALATAAAALMLSGCGSNPAEKMMSKSMAKSEMKVHCSGVNSCKGHGECATAKHSCKGKNSCKGHGWVSMSKDDCSAKGGKVVG